MKLLAFVRNHLILFFCALACIAGCAYWLLFTDDSMLYPEEKLAAERFSTATALGWGWLHVEDVTVRSMKPAGKNVNITFAYTVVVDKESEELSERERELFYKFLPTCGEAALTKGGRCSMEEMMEYTLTEKYGWMPSAFVEYRPELLPSIQRGGKPH